MELQVAGVANRALARRRPMVTNQLPQLLGPIRYVCLVGIDESPISTEIVEAFQESVAAAAGKGSASGRNAKLKLPTVEATVLARYPPTDDKRRPLPESIALFCCPDGVELEGGQSSAPEGTHTPGIDSAKPYSFVLTDVDGARSVGHCLRASAPLHKLHGVLGPLAVCFVAEPWLPVSVCHSLLASVWPVACAAIAATVTGGAGGKRSFAAVSVSERRAAAAAALHLVLLAPTLLQPPAPAPPTASSLRSLQPNPAFQGLAIAASYSQLSCRRAVVLDAKPRGVHACPGAAAGTLWERSGARLLPAASAEAFRTLFQLLPPRGVVRLYAALLCEQRVLLHSKDPGRLTLAAEALQSLLMPLCWSHVYVPLLPLSLLEYLSAPVPLVMGVHTDYLGLRGGAEAVLSCYLVHLD